MIPIRAVSDFSAAFQSHRFRAIVRRSTRKPIDDAALLKFTFRTPAAADI